MKRSITLLGVSLVLLFAACGGPLEPAPTDTDDAGSPFAVPQGAVLTTTTTSTDTATTNDDGGPLVGGN